MKISHGELETCRVSPKAWLTTKTEGGGKARFGYNQALNYSLAELHKNADLTLALTKLNSYLKKFQDEKRKKMVRERLAAYASWLKNSGVIPVDSNVTIGFPFSGDWRLGGWVSRVDITSTGYSAVLFGAIASNWKTQLRMPLIQLAIAEKYGRPSSEIRVGFHDLNGNGTADFRFSKTTLDAAFEEFIKVGNRVRKLSPNLFL